MQQDTPERDAKRNAPLVPMVTSVLKDVTARMEPSVTISMVPVCVNRALKASFVRSVCAPRDYMDSSVTRIARVT